MAVPTAPWAPGTTSGGSGSVADGGVADPTFTDISFTTEPIVFNKHPSYNFVVRDFEQFNSPLAIRTVFMDAAIKGVAMNIDSYVGSLFNSTNFNVNTNVTATGNGSGTVGSSVSTLNLLGAKAQLQQQLVDTDNPNDMTLIQHPVPHNYLLADNAWTQQSIASELVAERFRTSGEIRVSMGAAIVQDPYCTYTGSAPSRTFTGAYFHRWAVAVATRPLPEPDAKVADYMYIMYKGIPLRITLAWTALKNGWVVMVEAGFGAAVVRPNMGILFSTTGG